MDIPRPSSAARRSTLSIPSKPDASLAEWTTKIKALQKQVDEDEEVETRRLEEEIAASRKARMRRSTNLGSRTNSVDLAQSGVAAVIRTEDRSVVNDEPLSTLDKRRNQDDALRKLMGDDTAGKSPSHTPTPTPSTTHAPTQAKRPSSPISLAAFIGGRATGPRLTKHAPQQDAHDPTQFEQRTHISAPHPVFGRGGVAMPGMTGKGSASIVSRAIRDEEARPTASSSVSSSRDRRISTPSSVSVARSAVERVQEREREVVPSYTGSSHATRVAHEDDERDRRISTPPKVSSVRVVVEKAQERNREDIPAYNGSSQAPYRQRTISTPAGAAPAKFGSPSPAEAFTTKHKGDPVPRPLSHSPNPLIRPITLHTSNASFAPSKSPAPRPSSATFRTPPPPSPSRSPQPAQALPGLARPIQPTPRPSFGSPQIPSNNPSPAFLKPPASKEPTPSLSRLKGRGFVKNMVEKSASLEVTSPEGSPTPDKGFSSSPGRRQSTVLDRWQHNTGNGAPPPVISPKPMPLRKSFTVDPGSPTSSSYSVPLKRDSTGPVLRSKASLPLLPTMKTGESVGASSTVSESKYNGPQLGSAKTVITYIQPTKTGEQPVSPHREHITGDADELGIRVRTRTTSGGLVQERGAAGLPAGTAGKPLSHPTKDRAKKPHKGKSATTVAARANSSKLGAIREASPMRTDIGAALAPSLKVDEPQRESLSLTTTETVASVLTASPTSRYPSPPSTKGRALSPVVKSAIPAKPSLDVHAPPLAATPSKTSPTSPLAPPQVARSPSVSPPQSAGQKPPSSPARHARIPSTGNRATVMDVAQTFTEALSRQPSSSSSTADSLSQANGPSPPASIGTPHPRVASPDEEEEEYTPPSIRNVISNWGRTSPSPRTNGVVGTNGTSTSTTTITAPPLEKRKSSYERYSAFILPPLAEERTPVPSPVSTLKREGAPDPNLLEEEDVDEIDEGTLQEEEPKVETADDVTQVLVEAQSELKEEVAPEVPVAVVTPPQEAKTQTGDQLIHLVHDDDTPLPHVNIDALYDAPRVKCTPDPDLTTISVEVLSIAGSTATAITQEAHVFYDSELLAVIHRAKLKSSGLVATKVWAWRGRHAEPGEREQQKVQELARRYGTTPVSIEQAHEPPEFVSVLGGTLATRQGTRTHWSAENTAMHLVRALQGVVFIDELDLGIKNLCSGYSYCISILGTFYVWHGRGSTAAEQRAALAYAQALAPSPENVVELTEDESQEDEMFWMILGEGDYAKADYWRWRSEAPFVDPRIWAVDAAQREAVQPILGFPAHPEFSHGVFLVDCIWEFYVLVGSEARGQRLEIRTALSVAEGLAHKASSTGPFKPTVHALVFPTQIPTDLLLTFRELDESVLNVGEIPDHMNLISSHDADANLKSTTWTPAMLSDHTMLPLGVNPSHLS